MSTKIIAENKHQGLNIAKKDYEQYTRIIIQDLWKGIPASEGSSMIGISFIQWAYPSTRIKLDKEGSKILLYESPQPSLDDHIYISPTVMYRYGHIRPGLLPSLRASWYFHDAFLFVGHILYNMYKNY